MSHSPREIIRRSFSTNNPYEKEFGYSRAVRRGPFIFVSGTTSIDPDTGELRHPTSAYNQAIFIFTTIIEAVNSVGGKKEDITRVRMFVTGEEDAGSVGVALKNALGDIKPAATLIIGARFVSGDMKVEIEADALVI